MEPSLSSLPGEASQFLDVVSPDSPHCKTEVSFSLGLLLAPTPQPKCGLSQSSVVTLHLVREIVKYNVIIIE